MVSDSKKIIAVFGATGRQGGSVLRALKAHGQFATRALTRDPKKHPNLADEVVEADLDRPETLRGALAGAHGAFLVTNFWQPGTNEAAQAAAVIAAAREAGVKHLIWSTLPDVEVISGGRFEVPHFTGKAKIDDLVRNAGFNSHNFVVAPFYYENLNGVMAPQVLENGTAGWSLPLDPNARVSMGDIEDLGDIVAGAFAKPDQAGPGAYLPLVGDDLSFNDVVRILGQLGHQYSVRRADASQFPDETAAMFAYFAEHGYMGPDLPTRAALANAVAGKQPARFESWAREHFRA